MSERQFSLSPECYDQPRSPLHRTQSIASEGSELSEVFDAEVGDFMLLEVSPDVFGRVELWRISGQKLDLDVPVKRFDELANQAAFVHAQPVPDDQQLAFDLSFERLQKLDDLSSLDRTGKQAEVELPVADARDHRKLLPVEAILQHRGLRLGRPSAYARGPLGQPRLVYEDDGSSLRSGVFFSAGQRLFFHLAMAFSSRCNARLSGRWQLQPIAARSRDT